MKKESNGWDANVFNFSSPKLSGLGELNEPANIGKHKLW